MKLLIYGAGSIGNHLANAARQRNFDVTITDLSESALNRTQYEIYPQRYGCWDDSIRLIQVDEVANERFDGVIIGTPPDTHMKLAINAIRKHKPRVMMIEKPLCTPTMAGLLDLMRESENYNTKVLVGYNHTLTEHTVLADNHIKTGVLGQPLCLTAYFKEHWGGIFKAHPWLAGPHESYLGFYQRGGGATGEHSHAINIWQHFSRQLGQGRVSEVTAFMDIVKTDETNFDRQAHLCVKTETGFRGTITQDVITQPARKGVFMQGTDGSIEWTVNRDHTHDALTVNEKEHLVKKTRPDDFKGELKHFEDIFYERITLDDSPISISKGIETMCVIAAAYQSHFERKTIQIDYEELYMEVKL